MNELNFTEKEIECLKDIIKQRLISFAKEDHDFCNEVLLEAGLDPLSVGDAKTNQAYILYDSILNDLQEKLRRIATYENK